MICSPFNVVEKTLGHLAHFWTLQNLHQTMYMWAAHMHFNHFILQCPTKHLIPSTSRFRNHVLINTIPHPPWACNYDCPERYVSIRYVPNERIVDSSIESVQTFLMLCCTRRR